MIRHMKRHLTPVKTLVQMREARLRAFLHVARMATFVVENVVRSRVFLSEHTSVLVLPKRHLAVVRAPGLVAR